jgi:CheY-like chemotaxis protein
VSGDSATTFSAQESLLSETDFCLTDPFRLSDLIDCLRLIYVGERHKIGGMTLQVSPKPAEGKNLNGRQVLFVEDNCVHAEITQRIIAQSGMTGHWLNPNRLNYIDLKQSQDGLPKSISEPISDYLQKMDLILVDHFLGADGLDSAFCQYLEQMMRSIEARPVLMLTSNNGFEQLNQLPPVWAWGVLEKPLSQQQLMQVADYDGSTLDTRVLMSQWQSILSHPPEDEPPSAIHYRLLNRIFLTLQKLREQLWDVIQAELSKRHDCDETIDLAANPKPYLKKPLHLIHELKGTLMLLLPKETAIIQFLLEAERSLWHPSSPSKNSEVFQYSCFQYSWWMAFNTQLAPYYFALRRMLLDVEQTSDFKDREA